MSVTFRLRDASGAIIALHERHDAPDGSKRFTWRLPDGTPGLGGMPVADLPLYGIERLEANAPSVVVVEGERCAAALWSLGLAAVGTVTGASTTPSSTVLAELGGRRVILWPDADAVGRAHMAAIAERLVGLAASVGMVELPDGVAAGWDAADAVAEGRDIAALLAGPPPPTLAAALSRVEEFLRRYVVLPRPEAMVAVVLWVAHTHALAYAEATPYLAVSSPEKQSGKTRLLECLSLLAHDCTGIVITPTAATIYRSLEAAPEGTLLVDELDAVFRDRSDRYEEVRAVINAGHRRGASVPRSVSAPKNTWVVKQFPVFGPKALAGIGKLPDTVADRAIPIRMLKKKRTEQTEKFRSRRVRNEAARLVAGLSAALAAQPPALEADLPVELADRAADAWEPLVAIAEAAGGPWPARARRAAIILHAGREEDDSLGLRLLADTKIAFDRHGGDRMHTADLIAELQADDEGPWVSDKAALTPHRLARLLRPFEIHSKQLRIGATSQKGYERAAFADSWERYGAAPPSPLEAKHRNDAHEAGIDVSIPHPSEGDEDVRPLDLPVEVDYPRSAHDADDGGVAGGAGSSPTAGAPGVDTGDSA